MNIETNARELRTCLYEVSFVYRQLPRALERARLTTTINRWSSFFKDHVRSTREHKRALETAITTSGLRMQPTGCEEVNGLLAEMQYMLTARPDPPAMERNIHELFTSLRTIVLKRLGDGVKLANRLGEPDLAHRLDTLCKEERQLEAVMQDPWRRA